MCARGPLGTIDDLDFYGGSKSNFYFYFWMWISLVNVM